MLGSGADEPRARAPGRSAAMNLPLIKLVVPVAGWATQGQYALVEACVEAGTEIPSHVAQREDVVLHVLDGALEVVVDRSAQTGRGRRQRVARARRAAPASGPSSRRGCSR